MSKKSLEIWVAVLAVLLVTTTLMLLSGLKAQGRVLADIESVARMQDGWIYFPDLDKSKANYNE